MSNGKQTGVYLVEVIPLTKSVSRNLSYFSSTRLASGTIVKVPLRKGNVFATVTDCRNAAVVKTSIRRAEFPLRKISKKDVCEAGFTSEFLAAIKKASLYYACSEGAIFSTILSKKTLDNSKKFFPLSKKKRLVQTRETLVFQMETEERYGQYRGLVRQNFARKKSVIFIVPTISDLEKAKRNLSQGIEQFVYDKDNWLEALKNTHPVLFITTPSGITFERSDLDTIIFERENSRAYRTIAKPYINYKILVECIAKETGRQLVFGDSILSVETLEKERRGGYSEFSLVRWRLPAVPSRLIDIREDKNKFEIFSPELKSLIQKAIKEKEKVFLFGTRKGLAPTTVCGDCGTLLPCLNCGAPVVLHAKRLDLKNSRGPTSDRIYICHACGEKRDSKTVCGFCGSWKLVPLGIGIEKIAAQAKETFHSIPVEILDKDYASTNTKARNIIKKFEEKGGILVGSELAFFHLEKVAYAVLVSIDSFFSIPDFKINERIFHLISRLREMAQKESIVQTRNIGKQVLAWATQGNIIDFYLNEIAERKELSYPPFSIFVKIEEAGSKLQEAKKRLLKWNPESYKNSLIIRLPRENWPDAELSKELALLPPQFSVKVDPESIL